MLMTYNQFIEHTNNCRYSYSEKWRVGHFTYLRPPKDMKSDGYKYKTIPKKIEFLKQSIDGIIDPKRNTFFRVLKPNEEFTENIEKVKNHLTFKIFEGLLPFLKYDLEISKRMNKKFGIDENIRGMFLEVIEPYPIGFFDKPQFQTSTLESFLVD